MSNKHKNRGKGSQIALNTAKGIWFTLKWAFVLCFIFAILTGGIVTGYVAALVKDDPVRSREEILTKMQENAQTGFVYFNDDALVGQLRSEEDRQLVKINDIPKVVIDAFLSVEDGDFNEHIGIDFKGIVRAAKQRILNEPTQTGGSTITQQVARRVFLSLDQTMHRKAKEIFLALRIERFMSKEQILLAYLNKIPFGNSASGNYVYGIQAASKGIFDIENLSDLHLAQAAYLAGLPQDPNGYSAFTGRGEFNETKFEYALDRQKRVLRRMLELENITKQQYDEALAFDVKGSLSEPKQRAYTTYPFLMIEVERRAAEMLFLTKNPNIPKEEIRSPQYAEDLQEVRKELLRGGYRIYTTIDQEMYDRMQEIAQNPENFTPDHPEKGIEQVGAVMIDNKTGGILAMMEGRDFYKEQLNHATQMERQPGSAMKPIAAYLPALESGDIQPAGVIDDIPMLLEDGTKGYHIPNNWNMRFHGIITARTALNRSYNIPALKLFNDVVGIQEAWDFAKELGITTITDKDQHAKTGVIGGMDRGTTVEELTNAFAAIGNQGKFIDAYVIRKIEDAEGNVIYERNPTPKQVFSEETAFLMTDMLRTVISADGSTGTTVRNDFKHYGEYEVVGKTGTTQFDRDSWFIGYSPDVTFGVWVGYDMPSTLITGQGTQRPLKIWSLVMDEAIEMKPNWFENKSFPVPDGVIKKTVSSLSGKLPSDLTREHGKLVTDWFNKKYLPTEEDNSLIKARAVRYNGIHYIAHSQTPDDMTKEQIFVKRPEPVKELYEKIREFLDEVPSNHHPMINNRRARISDYYPQDWDSTAPEEVDPREEDGKVPDPPSNLKAEVGDSRSKVTFEASPNEDVVGYRFYRSVNGGPFRTNPAQNVMTGDSLTIHDYINTSASYAYYITAVDIIGQESAPSNVVTIGDQEGPRHPFLPGDDDDGDGDDDDDKEPEKEAGDEHDRNGDDKKTEDKEDEPKKTDDENSSVEAASGKLPSAPKKLKVKGDGLTVELSWDANPRGELVDRYDVYYSREKDGEYELIGSSNSTEFQYIRLRNAGWYTVTAVNPTGSSPNATPVQLKADND